MSELVIDGATALAVAAGDTGTVAALPAPERSAGWWRAWRARFGLAEVCGTLAAVAGFAAGYLSAGSLLAAAGLATICEAAGFYGCIGAKTVAAARRPPPTWAGGAGWLPGRGTRCGSKPANRAGPSPPRPAPWSPR